MYRTHILRHTFLQYDLTPIILAYFMCYCFQYFKYKFRNTTIPANLDYLNPEYQTDLESMFEGYLTVASTVPNLIFNFLTALLVKR